DIAPTICTYVRVMVRPHRYTEPRFTLSEAGEISGVDYNVLNQWVARGLIQVGEVPTGMRRTLYSVADILTITLLRDLNAIIAMRPSIATAFIGKAQRRLAQIARGADDIGPHYLIGHQAGPDFIVSVMIKVRGLDWAEFEHPIAVVPIDALIAKVINRANEKIFADDATGEAVDTAEGKRRERV